MRDSYLAIADAVAADIAAGRLKPGDRLPPQRRFAHDRGIAASTAARAYADLVARGLVVGEVGRGTYVRAAPSVSGPALAEPAQAPVDLELIVPLAPEHRAALAPALAALVAHGLEPALRPVGPASGPMARTAAAGFLARGGWMPRPDDVLFAGSGRQAIAAVLAALAPAGSRIGVEALTYPVAKAIAARLGVTLVPLALDGEGVRPDALAAAHRSAPLRAVYLQPALHNPLGLTMGAARRADLAALLTATGMIAIEDAIYSFLADEPPLAALAPDHTILVDSLSKRIAPGLTLGFVAAPPHWTDRIAAALRSGGWAPGGFALAAGLGWIADGTARRLAADKRADAARRQQIAQAALAGLTVRADPRAYHLWLELPEGWRADSFTASAARQGIAVTPASAFAVGAGQAPAAVRLALAAPPPAVLRAALETLRRIAAQGGDPID